MERRTTGTVRANDVDLAYADAGEGDDVVVLVHGFTGAKEDFSDHLDPFAALGWRAVALDLRGHGESSAPAELDQYSFEVMAADVMAFVDTLGVGRHVLLGHSMGGMVAQRIALGAGDRLRGLILMDTSDGPSGMDPELADAGIALVRDQGVDALADLLGLDPGARSTEAHQRLLRERTGFAEFGDRKLRSVSAAMFQTMGRQLQDRPSTLDELGAITAPTLVVVGALDQPFVAPSRRMAEAIPGARLVEIADAGHSPQFEQPDRWFEAVADFLEEIR